MTHSNPPLENPSPRWMDGRATLTIVESSTTSSVAAAIITSARIAALNQPEDGTPRPDPYGWITALRAPAIKKLMAGDGPLQLSLFDQQDLAEITSPDFPGERLIACRNPVLAADRARTREELLAATEA